jgi:hypothetical protein
MCAVVCAGPTEVNMLISHGAEVNAVDYTGNSPLFFAMSEMSPSSPDKNKIIRILKQHGAKLTKIDKEAITAGRKQGSKGG